jgi:cyclohexanone monooxygenase
MVALGKPGIVKQLTCFQRHPQYSVPSGDGPVSEEYRSQVNERYGDGSVFDQVFNSIVAFGFEESTVSVMSVSKEDRQRIFQENWDKGNGFRFMFGTFCDISFNREAKRCRLQFHQGKNQGDCQG